MRIRFRLDGRKNVLTENGFPVVLYMTKNKKEKLIRTGYFSQKKDWDNPNELPKNTHPEYVTLLNYLEKKKIVRAKVIESDRLSPMSILEAERELTKKDTGSFYEDGMEVYREVNKRTYKIALDSFQSIFPDLPYESIKPNVAREYMETLLSTPTKNNKSVRSPNGVISYMNTLTAIWNRLDRPNNPFSGIRPRKVRTKNKGMSSDDLIKIMNNEYPYHKNSGAGGIKNYLNYFMLCFYLGGIDLNDLRNLRYDRNVINGRVEFTRGKGGTEVFVSNKIFPEAQEILDIYDCRPYLVPLATMGSYNSFIPNMSRQFGNIKDKLGLSKKPYSKAPRYSFITRAQQLLIDERITIEIVGHSQHSTHSIYKDEFPYEVRDRAHRKIIEL